MPRRFSLIAALAVLGAATPTCPAADEEPRPVIHLDFSRAQGGEAPDVSGHSNHGRIAGAAGLVETGGRAIVELRSAPPVPDKTQLVYKQQGKHCGFPNLLLLNSGDLLVHCRLGRTHAGENGVIAQVRSTDGGRTWSDARVVASHPEIDFRTTSSGIQLPDGRILLPFYPYVAERTPHSHPGPLMIVSDDNGQTWSKPIELPDPFADHPGGYHFCYTCGKIIRVPDGGLLLGIHGASPDQTRSTGVVFSRDEGRTWTDYRPVAADGKRAYYEPSFAVLANGGVLALNRTEPEPHMYRCMSKDSGRTWSPPERTAIQGDVPELIVLRSGSLLCSYRSQEPGTNDTRMCISRDQGQTWEDEIVIDPNGGDHGYTSSVQLPDDSVLTVNYCGKDGCTQIRSNVVRESDFDHPPPWEKSGHVEMKDSPTLRFSRAISIEAWVRPVALGRPCQRIVVREGVFSLYVNQQGQLDGWIMAASDSAACDAVSRTALPPDRWTHVAMTYGADDPARQVRLYLDGREAGYATVEQTPPGAAIRDRPSPIFVGSPLSSYAADLQVADVRVYNAALKPERIALHAESAAPVSGAEAGKKD